MTPGRIIQFRLPSGEWRPGIVLDALPDRKVQAVIFTHPMNGESRTAGGHNSPGGHTVFVTAREGEEAGCWRWPPREDGLPCESADEIGDPKEEPAE